MHETSELWADCGPPFLTHCLSIVFCIYVYRDRFCLYKEKREMKREGSQCVPLLVFSVSPKHHHLTPTVYQLCFQNLQNILS